MSEYLFSEGLNTGVCKIPHFFLNSSFILFVFKLTTIHHVQTLFVSITILTTLVRARPDALVPGVNKIKIFIYYYIFDKRPAQQ